MKMMKTGLIPIQIQEVKIIIKHISKDSLLSKD